MSNGTEHIIETGGTYAHLSDPALWNKVKEGDRGALDYIYRQHFRPLFGYGMKVHADETLVQDAIHDVFVSIWQGRSGLSSTDSIRFYLLSSLKRRILRHLGRQLVLSDDDTFYDAPASSPEDDLIGRQNDLQRRARLAGVMSQLPPRQQEVLYLRYYHGLDTRETADIMSLSVNSAYVLLSKALKYLKDNSDKIVFAITFLGNGIIY